MFASWSSRVPTTRSPGRKVVPMAREMANVMEVMLGPNTTPAGSALNNCPTVARVRSSSSSALCAASKSPPPQPLEPSESQLVMAVMAVSTTCVPAGPSKRAHPSLTPGKR